MGRNLERQIRLDEHVHKGNRLWRHGTSYCLMQWGLQGCRRSGFSTSPERRELRGSTAYPMLWMRRIVSSQAKPSGVRLLGSRRKCVVFFRRKWDYDGCPDLSPLQVAGTLLQIEIILFLFYHLSFFIILLNYKKL